MTKEMGLTFETRSISVKLSNVINTDETSRKKKKKKKKEKRKKREMKNE